MLNLACPNSKVAHVGCKTGKSRCFNVERSFEINPADIQQELCKCSELALKNNLNYFKINKRGTCSIGTASAENCPSKKSILSRRKCSKIYDTVYKTESI